MRESDLQLVEVYTTRQDISQLVPSERQLLLDDDVSRFDDERFFEIWDDAESAKRYNQSDVNTATDRRRPSCTS